MTTFFNVFGTANLGIVWHFQTVGHVAGEAYIEDGSTDALVLYHVNNACDERSRLPGKGAAGLEDNLQMWVALVEALHQTYQ